MEISTGYRTQQFLEYLLAQGRLESRHDACLKRMRRSHYWNDADEAEDATDLAAWSHAHRMRDYAEIVALAVEGMLAVAETNSGTTATHVQRIVRIPETISYPVHHALKEGSLVVLVNPAQPHWHPQPENAHLFNPEGKIGIKALVLLHSWKEDIVELHAILPYRAFNALEGGHNPSGLTIATITTEGIITALNCVPATEEPDLLMKLLGLNNEPLPALTWPTEGYLDEAVGLPDAGYYLADQLPKLRLYLEGVAAKLRLSEDAR